MSEVELVVITRESFEAIAGRFPELAERRRVLAEEQVERLKEMTAVPESGKMEVLIRRGLVQTREALVIHTEKCTRCEMCVESCSAVHGGHPLIQLTGMRIGDLLLPASCYNCKTPECMLACRFGCITRDRSGQIYINEDTCTGCTLCSRKCPYGTIFMVDREEEEEERGFFARIFGAFTRKKEPKDDAGSFVAAPGAAPKPGQGGPPAALPPKGKAAPAEKTEKADEPAAKSAKKAKRLAVKCDLCMGHGFTACVYNCPTGAIERVSPEKLYEIL
jgi:Fe-S-cluster-containing hydrogenase component 2